MASQVSIFNQALTKLGAARITSPLDDEPQAKTLNAIWTVKLEAELTAHPWAFAIKRARIPASTTGPAFGWSYSYPLPTDCLRLVEVDEDFVFYDSDTGPLFQVESDPDTGRQAIVTDQGSPLDIRYVYRVTNTGLFPALFVEALSCRLAAEAAEALTQNLSKRQAAWQEWQQAIRSAKRVNAIEQPPRREPDLSWVRALTDR